MPEGRTKVEIHANGETLTLDAAPLVLLFHNGTFDLGVKDAVCLDPEATVYHGSRVRVLHPRTAELLAAVERERPIARTAVAYHHLVGLLDLTLKLKDQGRSLFWKNPEAYLHPWHQANLGDVAILLTKEGTGA
jgi:hypothetical protein